MGEAARRDLHFADTDDVAREVEDLLARGYTRAGSWSLGQMADHLARAIEKSLDGYPRMLPAPARWLIRWLYFKKIQRHEPLRRRVPAPKYLMPADCVEDRAGAERLKAALARLKAHAGPLHSSPVFGRLTTEEWLHVHLWHCEHHLSFLHPAAK
jgi:hypothetical protein